MLKNYFKIALRNLVKHKTYSIINMIGLTAGITSFLLIALFIQSELSFDQFHTKVERIFQITQTRMYGNTSGGASEREVSYAPMPLASILTDEAPEIEQVTRLEILFGEQLVALGENGFYENRIFYAEPNIFEVFDFDIVKGNPSSDLAEPFTIFLSETMAEKYVGEDEPVGKTITIGGGNGEKQQQYEIRGVFEDVPHESSIQFDFLISLQTKIITDKKANTDWGDGANTYVLLKKGVTKEQFAQRMSIISESYREVANAISFGFFPLKEVHLYGRERIGLKAETASDVKYVYLFSSIAFLVLLIACINYMNLSTARSTPRAREVGIRKVVGAKRGQLIQQFLSESVLLCFAAIIMAIVLLEVLLPLFSNLIERELSLNITDNLPILILLIVIGVGVGLLSGIYPAFVLSAFKPINVLKNIFHIASWNTIRKGLVVFQFSISVLLIFATIIIKNQLAYMDTKNLGFDKEQVVSIPLKDALNDQHYSFKDALLKHSSIDEVSLSSSIPGTPWGIYFFKPEDIEGYTEESKIVILHSFPVDESYLSTMGIALKEGRSLSQDYGTDEKQGIVLNEAAVKKMGWDTAVGKKIKFDKNNTGTVVGVVKDFHFSSLKGEIEPVIMTLSTRSPQFVSVRISAENVTSTMSLIGKTWDQFAPAHPLTFEFLDDTFDAMYREEQRLGSLFGAFSALAIIISILGIFGLAAYTTERRAKEIGIRKVLGASVSGIVALLSKEFLKLIVISFILAIPIAWYFMNNWLQDFAYRIEIGPGTFLIAALLTIGVALGTVSFQSIKTAFSNPVDSLKSD